MPEGIINSTLLSEQVVTRIKQYIQDSHMKAGDKLPNEFQLAEICGVGRSTVREAIKRLVFEGNVEVVRGCGTFLLDKPQKSENRQGEPDPFGFKGEESDIAARALEFLDARLIIEPEIAAMAAANATYKECQTLRKIQQKVAQCVTEGRDHLEEDIRFHTQIAECAHNKVLRNLIKLLVKGIPIFVQVTENTRAIDTICEHENILEAIAGGDGVGARCAMIAHLNSNRQRILQALEREKSKMSDVNKKK